MGPPPPPWIDTSWGEMSFRRTGTTAAFILPGFIALVVSCYCTRKLTRSEKTMLKATKDVLSSVEKLADKVASSVDRVSTTSSQPTNQVTSPRASADIEAQSDSPGPLRTISKIPTRRTDPDEIEILEEDEVSISPSSFAAKKRRGTTAQQDLPFVPPDVFISFRFGEAHAEVRTFLTPCRESLDLT